MFFLKEKFRCKLYIFKDLAVRALRFIEVLPLRQYYTCIIKVFTIDLRNLLLAGHEEDMLMSLPCVNLSN